MRSLDQLSRVAQDYLKAIWAAVEWDDPPITTKGLANRFGTSQAAVSETVRRLACQELLVYEPYQPVRLTAEGERLALAMVRRHRLLETFLVDIMGYALTEVHEDAERLEHAASEQFLTRLDALLGNPRFDPHGDPIPQPDMPVVLPPTLRLADAEPGDYRVIRLDDSDKQRLARLVEQHLVPGALLSIGAAHILVGDVQVSRTDDHLAVRVASI